MNNSIRSEGRQDANKKKPFHLLQYFTITSLVAFVLIAISLVTFYREVAVNDLIGMGESKNVALTQIFSNAIWPEFTSFLSSVSGQSAEEIRANPETARLRQTILEQMNGLSIVRIKIYNLQGITIFSTEQSQIGEDESKDDGFVTALGGGVISLLTHGNTLNIT